MTNAKHYHFETLQLHAGHSADPATRAAATPIYQTTSYAFRDTQEGEDLFGLKKAGYIYSRLTNPTQAVLEERIAALEGGSAALALASGSAAVTYAVLNLAQSGDEIVSESFQNGINLVCSKNHRDTYVFGHFEYDRGTLPGSTSAISRPGKIPEVPEHYFPGDNPGERPEFTWKSSANLFFRNWINLLYEETPFDLKELLSAPNPGIPSETVEDPE